MGVSNAGAWSGFTGRHATEPEPVLQLRSKHTEACMICSHPGCNRKLAKQNLNGFCPDHKHLGRRRQPPAAKAGVRQITVHNAIPGTSADVGRKTAVSVPQEPWA